MRNILKKVVFPALFLVIGTAPTQAMDLLVDVGPSYWQYKESAAQTAGFALTPLGSNAHGYALAGSITLKGEPLENWLVYAAANSLTSLNKASEHWNTALTFQNNKLEIREYGFDGAILRAFDRFQFGLWSAYQRQEQHRSAFVINGVPSAGTAIETVSVAWGGLALEAETDSGHIRSAIHLAVPMWTEVTNSSIPGVRFDTRKGFRAEAEAEWRLPWQPQNSELFFKIGYRYQELGNQVVATALWPRNTLSVLTTSLLIDW